MPENKFSILCTRPLNDLLINKASDRNIFIDTVSFIETEPINSTEVSQTIQSFASQKIKVVFTSVNAVEAVSKQLINKPDWNIFCLGGITKESVFKLFGETFVARTAKNATALAEKIIQYGNVKEVVFFCGDHRLDELPETLRFHDINVKEVVVYKTIQTPVFIEKDYDGIIFFSPGAVHSFFSMNTIAINVILFSIGKTTTAVIKSYCTNTVITSEWPGKEHMIEQVIEYYKQKPVSNNLYEPGTE